MGIEPTSSAWKAEVLPLNYARRYPKAARLGYTLKNAKSKGVNMLF
jgi:hypothetical protein